MLELHSYRKPFKDDGYDKLDQTMYNLGSQVVIHAAVLIDQALMIDL